MARTVYLDEQIDVSVGPRLRDRGFDVVHAHDAGTDGWLDEGQLTYATIRGWVLVTRDDDFEVIHSRGQAHSGIIRVRAAPPERMTVRIAMILVWVGDAWDQRLVRWSDLQMRIERGYRVAGFTEIEVRDAIGH